MAVSRKKALEYAEHLMERPRRALQMELRHTRGGITLLHNGKAVTRCYATKVGRLQAIEVARALGVELPQEGEVVEATVPNGAFYRAIAISSLPLDLPEVLPLLERYQEEAALARSTGDAIET